MFFHVRMIALAIAGAGLITFPAQAATVKPAAAPQIALPNAPFSVQPAKAVIKRFDLVSLLSPMVRKDAEQIAEFKDIDKAIVFEGNVTLDELISINTLASKKKLETPFEEALLKGDRMIVINGDLRCRGLSTDYMHGIFVLGNVDCDRVDLGLTPFYVKGNLLARKSLLGSAEDDEGDGEEGKRHVVVGGTVSSPKVRTWYFGLGHLKFASDSAKEVLVEQTVRESSGPCDGDKNC